MIHKKRRIRGTKETAVVLLLAAILLSAAPMQAAAQEELSLSLDRIIGIALPFGGIIQGTFTLRGSGSEAVRNLTVFFNGEQVHFVLGNTISWQFNTGDYPAGSTNITLFGVDDVGVTYHASTQVMFLSEAMGAMFLGVVLIVVVILIILKYVPMLREKKSTQAI